MQNVTMKFSVVKKNLDILTKPRTFRAPGILAIIENATRP